MYRTISRKIRKTVPLWGAVLWAGIIMGGLALFTSPAPTALAATCNWTNIVYCGLDRKSLSTEIDSARNLYNDNKDSKGRSGIQTAFNWAGYNSSIIAGMSTANTKAGTLYTDGRIVVDGAVINNVSQGVWVTTRLSDSGRQDLGGGIYARPVPSSQTTNERVLVTFNPEGVPMAVVMVNCGNAVKFTPVAINAQCLNVTAALVDRTRRLYSFTANTRAENAALVGGSFNFGDGTNGTGALNGVTVSAKHAFAKDGNYTITATVRFTIYGFSASRSCSTAIKIESPGVSIQKTVNGVEKKELKVNEQFTYELVVKNTATLNLTNVVVTDTAPQGVQFVSAGQGKITDGKTYRHTIPSLAPGASMTLKITAKVTSYTNAKITNTACVNAPEVDSGSPAKDDDCDTADLTLAKPLYECTKLMGPLLSGQTMGYRFTAESKTANGAVLKRALFVFGDGQSRAVNADAGSSVVTTDYTYQKEGAYSAYATLYFDVFGTEKAAAFNCYAKVEPSKPAVPECKPGVPVGDIRCNPCEYDASIPQNDPRCAAPAATLPNTGAGNVIALASAALVGGFLWYRHVLFQRHKRAYLQADFGTSPLPLAEPLESPDPLAATPLAEKAGRKLSLRRRRQF